MEARLTHAGVFKRMIDAVREMVKEVNMDFSADGMALQCMDSNHVALVTLQMHTGAFEQYKCQHAVALGVDLSTLGKVLKCANNDDTLTLVHTGDNDVLSLLVEGTNSISDFHLKLMDIDTEHLGVPETEWQATVTMPSVEFQRICKDLLIVDDTVCISVDKQAIKFSVDGLLGTGNTTLRSGEEVTIVCPEEVGAQSFALRYLNMFTRATPLSDTVILHVSHDIPLSIEYPIPNVGLVRFYLAPKVS